MAKSKTDIIKEYLSQNPGATGKEAEQSLKKHGINAQYFSQIKSSISARKKRAKKKPVKTTVKRKVVRVTNTLDEVQAVAEFAKEFGGLDKLSSAVEALRRFQMKAT